ncbi:MAG: phosphoribosylaminoimidazolesuccinocarboxamide synthase [Phycisphaerae bacterium]
MIDSAMSESTEKGFVLHKRGKVRDVYMPDEHSLLIVACDQISAFDHVLPTPVPGKGRMLTRMSNFWFEATKHIVPNHIIDPDPGPKRFDGVDWYYEGLRGRTVMVRKTAPLAIEAIVRGYISGSGWKEYQRSGTVCGIPLPRGLRESEALPEPIFTPSTKATSGHDENISFKVAAEIVGDELASRVRQLSLALYRFAADYAGQRGIIIADTKFEFGLTEGGELILIDEALTPDSSRFWDASLYEVGRPQDSYDKQFVRDYLETIGWDKKPPVPHLPEEIVARTAAKYEQAMKIMLRGKGEQNAKG